MVLNFARAFRAVLRVGAAAGLLLRDRKGATSLLLSATAVALISLAGFATEGGTWYLERRHGQNTADAAAMGGALTLATLNAAGTPTGTAAGAVKAGTSVATLNGYTAGTSSGTITAVTVAAGTYTGTTFTPSSSGTNTAANGLNAVKATISRTTPALFSSLLSATGPTITETAIARIDNPGPGCSLSLNQPLSFSGSTTVTANACTLASNNTSSTGSISCGGASVVTAQSFVAVGGISGCGGTDLPFRPATTNPFQAVNSVTMPPVAASASTCQNWPATITAANTFESSGKMFCTGSFGSGKTKTSFTGDVKITGNSVVNLVPGTYVFYDAGISIQSGTLECTTCTPGGAGVTIILTGSSPTTIGSITINGNATVTLNAPYTNAYNAAFDGILVYIDQTANPSNVSISMKGGATVTMNGGIYAPSVPVSYTGNSANSAPCTELVAYQVTFTGNSNLTTSGCSSQNTKVAMTQVVDLVQ